MHGGLEVRPSRRAGMWRVDVVSRARDGAVLCWHKGLEVCGRGDVEAKASYCETNSCRSPEDKYTVPQCSAATIGSF